jgi:quinol-cytochrome oxidoreductase complex cytochrome b subunit
VLPLAAFGIIGIHLLFIQRQGMAPPVGHTSAPRGMRFFPNFAVRDLLLWLFCFALLLILATLMPYGPGIPGIDWELGHKADPLAPAYPGIKPEWYFLWVYQLLKEFPPHLLGMEGPELCLLIVGVLLTSWLLVPWLDRKSRRDEPSPAFSDYGFAAIYFLSFLTLKAWDIGVAPGANPDESLPEIARACSLWTFGLAAVLTAVRVLVYEHRWFILSATAIVHVLLHGVVGLSYLAAGAVAVAAAAVALAIDRARGAAGSAAAPGGKA